MSAFTFITQSACVLRRASTIFLDLNAAHIIIGKLLNPVSIFDSMHFQSVFTEFCGSV